MKKFLKVMTKIIGNSWVQLVFLCAAMVGLFALGGAFASADTAGQKILELLTSGDILSIFLAAAVSLIVANIIIRTRKILEESLKIEDDHHKIITMYSGHKKRDKAADADFYSKDGSFMYLKSLPKKRKPSKNPVADPYSDGYKKRQADIDSYINGKLYLPSVDVFTNILGDTELRFSDCADYFELPSFISENTLALLGAHKMSSVKNGVTIRLDDIDYTDGVLTLKTRRSHYYDMLVTNRCMDFELDEGLTVRKMYECADRVTPLDKSQLCNQIGINGLIFTKDGYLLIEKRGRKKTTWKDKFAQPISLAMKASDVKFNADGLIGGEIADADAAFKNIILKTVAKNFALGESDLLPFDVKTAFLGIARDLLEGGKPNMYFYVTVNKTARELKEHIEYKCKRFALTAAKNKKSGDELLPSLTADKIDSAFYLIPGDKIFTDYEYAWNIKSRDMLYIKRKFAPRVPRLNSAFEGTGHKLRCAFNRSFKKECGEALLACLYFAEVCRARIDKSITDSQKESATNA